jgi:hypothetical protein
MLATSSTVAGRSSRCELLKFVLVWTASHT